MGYKNYHHHNAAVHAPPTMRNSRRVTIGPRSMGWIDAYVSGHVGQSHSFLSFYAEDEDPISIPNFHFSKAQHRYRLPVINDTSTHFTFPAGQILGDVVQHQKSSTEDENAASIFHAISGRNLDPKLLVKKREEMNSSLKTNNEAKQSAESSEQQQQQQQQLSQQQEVKFSEIEDINKVSPEILSQFHTSGLKIDIEVKPSLIDEKDFMRLKVNVEEERKKGATCDMWDDHTDKEYHDQFKKSSSIDSTNE